MNSETDEQWTQPTDGHGLYFLLPQSPEKLTVVILHSSILRQKKKHLFRKQQEKDLYDTRDMWKQTGTIWKQNQEFETVQIVNLDLFFSQNQ